MTPDDTLNPNASTPEADPDHTDTPTDPLQPADDIFNPLTDQEKLEGDGLPPAAVPDDLPPATVTDQHPITDTELDPQEAYDVGLDAAADAPQNSGNLDGFQQARDVSPLEPTDEAEDEQQ